MSTTLRTQPPHCCRASFTTVKFLLFSACIRAVVLAGVGPADVEMIPPDAEALLDNVAVELVKVPEPSRRMFGLLIRSLDATRREVGALRADKEALFERVADLERLYKGRGDYVDNERARAHPSTDTVTTDSPKTNTTTSIGIAEQREYARVRQLAETGGPCTTRSSLIVALARVETVCCVQSDEECDHVIGFEQRLPTSCAAAACACAVHNAQTDCGPLLDASTMYSMQHLKSALDVAGELCVSSSAPVAVPTFALQNTPITISGCSGVITDGCGEYTTSPIGQRTARIVTPAGWQPRLTPTTFNMAGNDNLRAFSGPDSSGIPIIVDGNSFMTGANVPPPFTATGNEMTLLEVTTGEDTSSGYTLRLSCVCDGCQPGTCVLDGAPQQEVCGANGYCEERTGICQCAPGFGGPYCDQFTSTCSAGDEWEAQVARVMDACCPDDAGGEHRRGLQDHTCALPEKCPSVGCATAFIAFFKNCHVELVANAQTLPMDEFTSFNADCQLLLQPSVVSTGVPRGSILQWSGTIAEIPDGWALCDGSNGTPNLNGRLIVAAGTSAVPTISDHSVDDKLFVNTGKLYNFYHPYIHDEHQDGRGYDGRTGSSGDHYYHLPAATLYFIMKIA